MIIDNGARGPKTSAKVDLHNRIATTAVIGEYDFAANADTGKAWTINIDSISATAADDYIFYLKNTGDKVIHIADIRITGTAQSTVEANEVTGTAAGGTDVTPVPKTLGSAASLDGTVQTGSDITGLTEAGTIYYLECETANKEYWLHTSTTIRIPKNKAIGFLAKSGTPTFRGTVSVVTEENGFA